MRQASPPSLAARPWSIRGAVPFFGGGLRSGRIRLGAGSPCTSTGPRASQVRPHQDPLDRDLDRDTQRVDAPPALPERSSDRPRARSAPSTSRMRGRVVLDRRAERRACPGRARTPVGPWPACSRVWKASATRGLRRIRSSFFQAPTEVFTELTTPAARSQHGEVAHRQEDHALGRRRVGEHQRVVAIQDLLHLV